MLFTRVLNCSAFTSLLQCLVYVGITACYVRPPTVGKPKKLSNAQVDVIIEYCSENYEQRCLDYNHLVLELKLKVTASTL